MLGIARNSFSENGVAEKERIAANRAGAAPPTTALRLFSFSPPSSLSNRHTCRSKFVVSCTKTKARRQS